MPPSTHMRPLTRADGHHQASGGGGPLRKAPASGLPEERVGGVERDAGWTVVSAPVPDLFGGLARFLLRCWLAQLLSGGPFASLVCGNLTHMYHGPSPSGPAMVAAVAMAAAAVATAAVAVADMAVADMAVAAGMVAALVAGTAGTVAAAAMVVGRGAMTAGMSAPDTTTGHATRSVPDTRSAHAMTTAPATTTGHATTIGTAMSVATEGEGACDGRGGCRPGYLPLPLWPKPALLI